MKDILNIMRFDFLCAQPVAMGAYIAVAAMCFLLSLFLSPGICAYIIAGAMFFVIPLQNMASKSDFNKLYGILPVQRKTITRARFLYIFSIFFVSELAEMVLTLVAYSLKLNRLIPDQKNEIMQFVDKAFSNLFSAIILVILSFAVICLVFAYLQMMGQIFGKESEMKVILVTVGILTTVAIAIIILSDKGIIPTLQLPELPETIAGQVILSVVINAVMLGVCMLFGEITANQLAKREL